MSTFPLVEYSDSDSECSAEEVQEQPKKELAHTNQKRKLSSLEEIESNTLEPPTKKQKLSDTNSVKTDLDNEISNEGDASSESDINEENIAHTKKKKKIKLKKLSKASLSLNNKQNKNTRFLNASTNTDDKLRKMERDMFNKHNAKQMEKQQKEKEQLEFARQSETIKAQQKQIINKSQINQLPHKHAQNRNSKTVKEKEKAKRMKGQSSHHSWKSESFMLLRQQFD
eukprot:466843_1